MAALQPAVDSEHSAPVRARVTALLFVVRVLPLLLWPAPLPPYRKERRRGAG